MPQRVSDAEGLHQLSAYVIMPWLTVRHKEWRVCAQEVVAWWCSFMQRLGGGGGSARQQKQSQENENSESDVDGSEDENTGSKVVELQPHIVSGNFSGIHVVNNESDPNEEIMGPRVVDSTSTKEMLAPPSSSLIEKKDNARSPLPPSPRDEVQSADQDQGVPQVQEIQFTFDDGVHLYFLIEFIPGGGLYSYIKQNKKQHQPPPQPTSSTVGSKVSTSNYAAKTNDSASSSNDRRKGKKEEGIFDGLMLAAEPPDENDPAGGAREAVDNRQTGIGIMGGGGPAGRGDGEGGVSAFSFLSGNGGGTTSGELEKPNVSSTGGDQSVSVGDANVGSAFSFMASQETENTTSQYGVDNTPEPQKPIKKKKAKLTIGVAHSEEPSTETKPQPIQEQPPVPEEHIVVSSKETATNSCTATIPSTSEPTTSPSPTVEIKPAIADVQSDTSSPRILPSSSVEVSENVSVEQDSTLPNILSGLSVEASRKETIACEPNDTVNNQAEVLRQKVSDLITSQRETKSALELLSHNLDEFQQQQQQAAASEDYTTADQLTKQIAQINEQIAEKQAEINNFESEVDKTRCELSLLEMKEATETVEQLKIILEEKRSTVLDIEEQIEKKQTVLFDTITAKTTQIQRDSGHAELDLKILSETEDKLNCAIHTQAADHFEEKRVQEEKLSLLQGKIEELLKQVSLLKEEASLCEKSIHECDEKISVVSARHKKELDKISSERKQIAATAAQLNEEKENLNEFKQKSEAEIQQLEQVKSTIQAEIESMNAILDKEMEKIQLLKKRDTFIQEIRSVQHKIFDVETDLRVNTASIEEQLAKAEQSMVQQTALCASSREAVSTLQAAISSIDTALPSLETKKKAAAQAKDFKTAGACANEIKIKNEQKQKHTSEIKLHEQTLAQATSDLDSASECCTSCSTQLKQCKIDAETKLVEHLRQLVISMKALISCSVAVEDFNEAEAMQLELVERRDTLRLLCNKHNLPFPSDTEPDHLEPNSVCISHQKQTVPANTKSEDTKENNGNSVPAKQLSESEKVQLQAQVGKLAQMIEEASQADDFDTAESLLQQQKNLLQQLGITDLS
ncbi:hypothetical protein Pelo_5169 [Pelomyxa schiedti]|nr:hypothetical protein Pelo_5169 [Pelomyxa schiedti]